MAAAVIGSGEIESFSSGQLINITGKSTGKGFSGLQKRHSFTRGPMTHGSKNHRAPGSIGMGTDPCRVLPGKKMAGQLGNKITHIKKGINIRTNLLLRKSFIPIFSATKEEKKPDNKKNNCILKK